MKSSIHLPWNYSGLETTTRQLCNHCPANLLYLADQTIALHASEGLTMDTVERSLGSLESYV